MQGGIIAPSNLTSIARYQQQGDMLFDFVVIANLVNPLKSGLQLVIENLSLGRLVYTFGLWPLWPVSINGTPVPSLLSGMPATVATGISSLADNFLRVLDTLSVGSVNVSVNLGLSAMEGSPYFAPGLNIPPGINIHITDLSLFGLVTVPLLVLELELNPLPVFSAVLVVQPIDFGVLKISGPRNPPWLLSPPPSNKPKVRTYYPWANTLCRATAKPAGAPLYPDGKKLATPVNVTFSCKQQCDQALGCNAFTTYATSSTGVISCWILINQTCIPVRAPGYTAMLLYTAPPPPPVTPFPNPPRPPLPHPPRPPAPPRPPYSSRKYYPWEGFVCSSLVEPAHVSLNPFSSVLSPWGYVVTSTEVGSDYKDINAAHSLDGTYVTFNQGGTFTTTCATCYHYVIVVGGGGCGRWGGLD